MSEKPSEGIQAKESTHVEEGTGMFQHQLAGVRLVLAVVHVDVELISLKGEKKGKEERKKG